MRLDRFFVETPLRDREGATVDLAGPEAHHLLKVLRRGPGDEVTLFDGTGHEARGRVAEAARARVRLDVLAVTHDPRTPALHITLAVALPRAGAEGDVMRCAIECGASRIVPLIARRSVHRDKRPEAERQQRFHRVAVSAMKQCGRNLMPELSPPTAVEALAVEDGAAGVFGSISPGAELLRAFEQRTGGWPRRVQLAIGPEGGWHDDEEDSLRRTGFHPVSLGPLVLRVENAVVAAVSWLASAPPRRQSNSS